MARINRFSLASVCLAALMICAPLSGRPLQNVHPQHAGPAETPAPDPSRGYTFPLWISGLVAIFFAARTGRYKPHR